MGFGTVPLVKVILLWISSAPVAKGRDNELRALIRPFHRSLSDGETGCSALLQATQLSFIYCTAKDYHSVVYANPQKPLQRRRVSSHQAVAERLSSADLFTQIQGLSTSTSGWSQQSSDGDVEDQKLVM